MSHLHSPAPTNRGGVRAGASVARSPLGRRGNLEIWIQKLLEIAATRSAGLAMTLAS